MRWQQAGWSDSDCLDFDFGMVWFDEWTQGKLHETVWGQPEEPPAKGQVRLPKYRSLAEVFAEYDDTWAQTKFQRTAAIPAIDMDAVIEAAYGDDILF